MLSLKIGKLKNGEGSKQLKKIEEFYHLENTFSCPFCIGKPFKSSLGLEGHWKKPSEHSNKRIKTEK